MKTFVFTKYGPPEVLEPKEADIPVPKKNEVRINVRATTVTSAEIMMRTGKPYWGRLILGLFRPATKYRILGIELAGKIEAVGSEVKRFKKGDQVYGFTGFHPGANAEFLCLPEKASLAYKPDKLGWEEAAASVDGASTALFFLRNKAQLRSGQKVLIIGASGSIGTFAVQLARYFGADVTGICSTGNVELVKSLGAHKVIDYTKEDFTRTKDSYDIIFDTVGKSSFSRCRHNLTSNGYYIPTVGIFNNVLMLWTFLVGNLTKRKPTRRVITGMSVNKNDALIYLRELLDAGKIKPVIDKTFRMDQIVEAHRYVEQGHKKGNVVIKIAEK